MGDAGGSPGLAANSNRLAALKSDIAIITDSITP